MTEYSRRLEEIDNKYLESVDNWITVTNAIRVELERLFKSASTIDEKMTDDSMEADVVHPEKTEGFTELSAQDADDMYDAWNNHMDVLHVVGAMEYYTDKLISLLGDALDNCEWSAEERDHVLGS